jgi:5-methylcytosine-specific restriction endonuclease McrA
MLAEILEYETKRLAGVERAKLYYRSHKQQKKEYDKAYRAANREKINEWYRKWRSENRERENAKAVARIAADPERHAKTVFEWRKKNSAWLKEYESKRRKNPERIEATRRASKAWKDAHPQERRNHVRNRRAKLRDGGVLSRGIEKKLMFLQRGQCAACHCNIKNEFQLDHIVPVSRGGSNTDSNAQLLCPRCNQSKSNKTAEEFMRGRGLLL